jgi:uncharacterized membrane-anchored protein YhcB (DUF1043 family)
MEIKKNIDTLFAIKDVVIELKTLVTLQIEQNKKQDEMLGKQNETMIKISDAVVQHAELIKKLSQNYEDFYNKYNQKEFQLLKDGSISLNNVIKDMVNRYLPPLIVAGVTYLILQITK